MSISCPKCGQLIQFEHRFCASCGATQGAGIVGPNQHSGDLISASSSSGTQETNPQVMRNPTQLPAQSAATQFNLQAPPAPASTQVVNMPAQQASIQPSPGNTVNVNVSQPPAYYPTTYPQPKGSIAFALITLFCYLGVITWPFGFIMNIVGLITGPRRGCFAALFFLVFVPSVILTTACVLLFGTGTFDQILREIQNAP